MNLIIGVAMLIFGVLLGGIAVVHAIHAESHDQKLERLGLLVPGCGFLCYAAVCLLRPGILPCLVLLPLGLFLLTLGRGVYETLACAGTTKKR